jgi:hypothetical protein
MPMLVRGLVVVVMAMGRRPRQVEGGRLDGAPGLTLRPVRMGRVVMVEKVEPQPQSPEARPEPGQEDEGTKPPGSRELHCAKSPRAPRGCQGDARLGLLD